MASLVKVQIPDPKHIMILVVKIANPGRGIRTTKTSWEVLDLSLKINPTKID